MIHIACDDLDLDWDLTDVNTFIRMLNEGYEITEIARYFNRDPDEIGILVIDQARKEKITNRLETDGKLQMRKKRRGRKVGWTKA